jgi:growth hormone-inducible transmembrane protein
MIELHLFNRTNMASIRPFVLRSTFRQIPKQFTKPTRLFKATIPFRPYSQTIQTPVRTGNLSQRLLYGAGIFGGTVLAINLVFNRETREDGLPLAERAYLNDTFLHTGLGIGIIGLAARTLHTSGWSVRLMASNPWLVVGGGLVASIATMYGAMAVDPDK